MLLQDSDARPMKHNLLIQPGSTYQVRFLEESSATGILMEFFKNYNWANRMALEFLQNASLLSAFPTGIPTR